MRKAIAIVLTGLLVTTPLKLVLAQADQQQSQTVAQETPVVAAQDSTSSPVLVGVPALERGSAAALLWSAKATAPAADSLAYDDFMYRRVSTVGWVVIVVVGAIVLLLGLFAIACAGQDCFSN